MGADLTKTGLAEVAGHEVKLLPDSREPYRAAVTLPLALLDLMVRSPAACLASSLMKRLLEEENVSRERSKSRSRKEEPQGYSNDLTKEQIQALQLVKQAFKLSNDEHVLLKTLITTLSSFKSQTSRPFLQEDNHLRDKSWEKTQQSSSSPSKQIKKVNFQTYEYLSKDIIREKSQEDDSFDSGSLGEDTEENVKNMNLDWNVNRKTKRTPNIGTTLKNLVTQNSMISSINIGSSHAKQPRLFVQKDDLIQEKENRPQEIVSPREEPNKRKTSARAIPNVNQNQGYIPRSYAGIYNAKKEIVHQKGHDEQDAFESRNKDTHQHQDPRQGRSITNAQTKQTFDSGVGTLQNFTSFKPTSLSMNPNFKVEKKLTFTDYE